MLVHMALVILSAAILVFFADECVALLKKLFAIPGVTLFLPFILATNLLFFVEDEVTSLLEVMYDFLMLLSQGMASFLPDYSWAHKACQAIALALLSILPVWIADAWSWRKTFNFFPYPILLGTVVWLVWVTPFVVLGTSL